MGNEPKITQIERVPSETVALDKTLNSKCHNNVEGKNKDSQKNKRQDSSKKKNKGPSKRKNNSNSDELDSDSEEDSSSEDSDIDNDSSLESSKEEMSQDKHTSSRFSTKSSAKKNKWKFRKQFKKWAKRKFLKHISNQEIKESILKNNPVPINFLSRQKLDDYLLEVLSETGKKDEIFSDRSLMKPQENLTNVM